MESGLENMADMKKMVVFVLGMLAVLSVKMDCQAAIEENEKLPAKPEFAEIKSLENTMLSQAEEILDVEGIEFEELSLNYADASKVYVDMDMAAISSTKEEDLVAFLDKSNYVWVIPVEGVSDESGFHVAITVSRGVKYDEERGRVLTEQEKQMIKDQEGEWIISEIAVQEMDNYVNQMKKAEDVIDHYIIVGGVQGLFHPIAIGFQNGTAKYWIGLGYDYGLLKDEQKVVSSREDIFDYETVKADVDAFKRTANVSGGSGSEKVLVSLVVFKKLIVYNKNRNSIGKWQSKMGVCDMTDHIKTSWEEVGLSNDFLFGKVMQNPILCKKLLERILPDLEIERIEYPELQKPIKPDADARSVRLDVYVKDGKDTVYDIEMQTTDTGELPKRSRYYQGMMDLQLIEKGQPYKKLNRSFIIFICLEDIFGKGRHIYTFENICKEDTTLFLKDDATRIFLNADSQMDDVSSELKAFLDYLAGERTDDAYVRELEEAVEEAKKNREWRHEYMTLLMRDQENMEKGMEKGIEKERQRIIVKMVKQGFSNEQIITLCDTSEDEIERCKKG